jgi:protein HOOK3
VAELRNELNKKADVSEEEKAEGLQAEHERMLALQQKTNEKLRDLELANEEKAGLLRAALLDRAHLSPELLELKRAETLRQIREQIQAVVEAPVEVQPNALDATSSEIAETVLSSEAALEKVKKVSNNQISFIKSPSSAFDAAISTMRSAQRLDTSLSAATLISPTSPPRSHTENNKSLSDTSSSTAGTGQSTWGRMTHMLLPRRRKELTPCGSAYFSALTSTECVASLSLA